MNDNLRIFICTARITKWFFYQADECKVRFQQGDGFHQDIELDQCEECHLYDEFHQHQGL